MKPNEETLIAEGKIPRQQFLPVFEDITQYLEYLNLDEPLIGLSYLIEIPGDIGDHSVKYNCTLCKVFAFISEAVQHVIGRKHRQKYLEKNRPDLVNWDTNRHQTMPGKIIRAKAEIAERQDGQGKPKPLSDRTKRRLLSIQGEPNHGQASGFTEDLGPNMPKFGSYSKGPGRPVSDDYVQERYEDTLYNRAALYTQERDSLGYSSGVRNYEREGNGDLSNVLGLQDQDRRQYGLSQREELHNDAFRKPPAQKDVLKEFYTEELRREKLAKAQKWPDDIDSHQRDYTRNPREIGPGANQSSYSTSLDGRKDYRHDALMRRPHEALSTHGPTRGSPSKSDDLSRKMSNIPDPFMRFLKGEPSHDEARVRKRKSRFSDATAEELQTAHEMFVDEYGPPDSKFPSRRLEIRELKTQQTDIPIGLKQTDTYQTEPRPERSESTGDVFEMLKNIEIENEEEANFLKERLCSVLREFKARKAKKAVQSGQSRSVQDYNNMRPVTQQHRQDRYGRTRRAEEEPYDDPFQESFQESYDEQTLDEKFQEHKHPVLPEARYSKRKPYEDVKRWANQNQPQYAPGFDMPAPDYDVSDLGYDMPAPDFGVPAPFPETFQGPLQSRDYQSADDFSDYPSSTSHLPMERGPRMNRPPQYSRKLDKITSTLLELVSRK